MFSCYYSSNCKVLLSDFLAFYEHLTTETLRATNRYKVAQKHQLWNQQINSSRRIFFPTTSTFNISTLLNGQIGHFICKHVQNLDHSKIIYRKNIEQSIENDCTISVNFNCLEFVKELVLKNNLTTQKRYLCFGRKFIVLLKFLFENLLSLHSKYLWHKFLITLS